MAEPASPRETVAARALGLTALTMLAFAGNSLLCRAALAGERIGPLSFTALRIAAGALVLGVLLRVFSSTHSEAEGPGLRAESGSWRGALALIAYALSFSVAYLSLDAGTGALVLFAAVQLTMMGASVLEGERPSLRVWLGSAVLLPEMAGDMLGLLAALVTVLIVTPLTQRQDPPKGLIDGDGEPVEFANRLGILPLFSQVKMNERTTP